MEILKTKNSTYTLHPKNYQKKTPFWLKVTADILVGSILVIDPIIITMPDFPNKEWVIFGWNGFVALFKFVSKTIADAKAEQA